MHETVLVSSILSIVQDTVANYVQAHYVFHEGSADRNVSAKEGNQDIQETLENQNTYESQKSHDADENRAGCAGYHTRYAASGGSDMSASHNGHGPCTFRDSHGPDKAHKAHASGNIRETHGSDNAHSICRRGDTRPPHTLHIEEVVVTVGVLSCVEPQTLRGCFEIMAEGTVAHKALLTIVTRPMKGVCPDCGQTVETVERRFSCPLCHGTRVDWQDGQGMEITSIRVVDNGAGKNA